MRNRDADVLMPTHEPVTPLGLLEPNAFRDECIRTKKLADYRSEAGIPDPLVDPRHLLHHPSDRVALHGPHHPITGKRNCTYRIIQRLNLNLRKNSWYHNKAIALQHASDVVQPFC
jgi:hypothetical protein